MKNSWLNDNIKSIMGYTVIVSVIIYYFVTSILNVKADQQITISFSNVLMLVLGYYFGSSSGSSKKDDTLNSIAQQPTVNKAETVNVNTDEK